ncbi:YbaN family protein [Prevotella sp. 10(H)]|uniref:YbaN family protein n=1 Tax=Prevotella sp. 10(H) TaxID=1158294 RepID=UPI000A9EE5EF|nr:YbaN family protein [Prevotella sp. 10(H)]
MRYLYITLGFITLSLGVLGIVTPGLPTTPFILLTGVLFAKSSPRLHHKLMNNKLTGRYLHRVNDGFTWKGLSISIGIMWCMICFTAFVVFDYGTMRFVMLGLGIIGTISQIIVLRRKRRLKTRRSNIEIIDEHIDKDNIHKAS